MMHQRRALKDRYLPALLIAFILFSSTAYGQYQKFYGYGYHYYRLMADSALGIPKDTFAIPATYKTKAHIAAQGDSLLVWSIIQQKWVLAGSTAFVQNQFLGKQTANAWFDSLKVSRAHITDRITGSMSGQSHLHLPFSAANGRGNVGIHIHNLPLWDSRDPYYALYGLPLNAQNTGPMFGVTRFWSVSAGDTNRIDYSQNIYSQYRYTFDGITFDSGAVGGGKLFYPGMPGIGGNTQYFVQSGKVVNMAVSQTGNIAAPGWSVLSFFGAGGGTINLTQISGGAAPRNVPLTANFSEIDFNRAALSDDKKVVRGFVSAYFASWKAYQGSQGFGSLGIGNSVDSVADFVSGGAAQYANFSAHGWTKDQILSHSRVKQDIGLYIYPRWGAFNETETGYGIVQRGIYDINHISGKLYILPNGTWITKANADTTSARAIIKGRLYADTLSAIYIINPITATGQFTISTSGSPLIVNSTNSNTSKIALQAAGVTQGYIGSGGGNAFIANSSGGVSLLSVEDATGNTLTPGQFIAGNTTSAIWAGTVSSVSTIRGLKSDQSAYNDISIRAQATPQLFLNTSGQVGINTSTFISTEKFKVDGNVLLAGTVAGKSPVVKFYNNTDADMFSVGVNFSSTNSGALELYSHVSGTAILSIKSTGLTVTGKLNTAPPEYADNAAAIAGGLVVGDEYRTGDIKKVVH